VKSMDRGGAITICLAALCTALLGLSSFHGAANAAAVTATGDTGERGEAAAEAAGAEAAAAASGFFLDLAALLRQVWCEPCARSSSSSSSEP
jgi:hypothetical protein